MWNMKGGRVFLVYIYIYTGFLVILYLNGSSSGWVLQKPEPNSDPLRVFFKRPILDPIIYQAG